MSYHQRIISKYHDLSVLLTYFNRRSTINGNHYRWGFYLFFLVFNLYACQDQPPKDFQVIDQNMAGMTAGDRVEEDDNGVAGEIADTDYDIAGDMAGEMDEGLAGELAGDIDGGLAGEMDGGMAGMMAGEMDGGLAGTTAGLMWDEEEAYGVPTYAQSTLLEVSGQIYLIWALGNQLWVQNIDENGDAVSLHLLDQIEGSIDYIKGKVVQGVPWVIYGAHGQAVYLHTADAAYTQASRRTLPLHGPALLGQSEQNLFVLAQSQEDERKAWMRINENTPASVPPVYAHHIWPMPDDIGSIAGHIILRFDQDGQCMKMNQDLEIILSYHCLYGQARFLENESISYLSYSSTQTDSAYVLLSHQLDIDTAFPFMQLWFDVNQQPTGLSYAQQSHRHIFTGIHRNSDEDFPQERVIILEPDGMWVSAEGWQNFPYPTARQITRKRNEAWVFTFHEDGLPQKEVVALQDNLFQDTYPFFLNYSKRCRPQKEICDDIDNDCDGIIDNGICCMPDRDPLFATFIPGQKPIEFLVSDTENRTTRFAVRVAEGEWEIWGFSYPQGGLEGTMRYYGSIVGAYDALGFTAVGDEPYSLMVAKNAEGVWTVFWQFKDYVDPPKPPEPLGCDRALTMGIVGAKPVSKAPIVICDDKIIHIKGKASEEDEEFPEPVIYDQIFRDFPDLEWATLTRHDFGSSSIVFAFQSLIDVWQVKRASISFAGDILNLVLPTDMSTELGLDESQVPHPLYLHTKKSPGVPGQFSTLEMYTRSTDDATVNYQARAHVNRGDDSFVWNSIFMGGDTQKMEYNGLHSKLVGTTQVADDQVGFWVVDLKPNLHVDVWRTPYQFVWQSPRGNEGLLTMQWHVTQGDYINYIFVMSQRADPPAADDADSPAPTLWEMTLYSVLSCTPHISY